jgi:membrane-associated phospholipid phosphatase
MTRPHICFVLTALLATASSELGAQVGLQTVRDDIAHTSGDVWSVWTSPARMSRHDWLPAGIAVGAVALTTQVDSITRVWMIAHERSALLRVISPLRDSSTTIHVGSMGTGYYLLPITGAVYIAGRVSHSSGLADAGLGCMAGDLSSLGIREVAYHAVGRGRPRITPDPFNISVPESGGWLWHSFFSGHIANSMACASFLSHRYSFGAAEALPYAFSAAIGLGRMADGEHWASDTMIGGIIGYTIGRAIASRQLARMSRSTTPSDTSASARAQQSAKQWPVFSWTIQF